MSSSSRKTLPLAILVPLSGGSDPELLEMEDCTEVYGDNVEQLFPEINDPCDHPENPTGQHVYGKPHDRVCIYCRKPSGLAE